MMFASICISTSNYIKSIEKLMLNELSLIKAF